MNKARLKKQIDSRKVSQLLNSSNFIGFLCLQNISVNEKTQLKKDLENIGFEYKFVKNAVIFQILFKALPNFKGILSGSLAIFYARKHNSVDFIALKKVLFLLKKRKHAFFSGGYFKGALVNNLFEAKINSLEEKEILQAKQISILQSILTNIITTTSLPTNSLSLTLQHKTGQVSL